MQLLMRNLAATIKHQMELYPLNIQTQKKGDGLAAHATDLKLVLFPRISSVDK